MPVPANSLTVNALSLVNAAVQELGVLSAGENLSSDDQAWVLQKLQRLIDTYNARRVMIYTTTFTSFALVANLAPHTIGPAGTFAVNQRPVEIPSIGLQLLNTSPQTVEVPLNARDAEWWASNRVKNLTSVIPTDYYYEPDWPLGSIYFWPVPSAVNNVLIQQRTVIIDPANLAAPFTMPPGYWNLIAYELAIECADSFSKQVSPNLQARYEKALRAVQSNNIKSPRGRTVDAGMPGGQSRSGDFNYYDAQPR